MNIGTAKPTATELSRYPHHLVDIIDPMQSYSVAEFVNDVARLIDECHQKGKIPLLVGGTMMYYMALLDGLSPVSYSSYASAVLPLAVGAIKHTTLLSGSLLNTPSEERCIKFSFLVFICPKQQSASYLL